jgi:hypothetical protein
MNQWVVKKVVNNLIVKNKPPIVSFNHDFSSCSITASPLYSSKLIMSTMAFAGCKAIHTISNKGCIKA